MGATPEGGGHGFFVGFDFLLELGEALVGWIDAYLRQRGVLEVSLPVVGLGVRHDVWIGVQLVVRVDNSISSVTMVKRYH